MGCIEVQEQSLALIISVKKSHWCSRVLFQRPNEIDKQFYEKLIL